MDNHGEIIVIFRTSDSEQSGLADGDEPPPQINSIDDVVEESKVEESITPVESDKYDSLIEFSYLCKVYDSASVKKLKNVSDFIENLLKQKHEEFLPKNDIVNFYESLREIECDDLLEGNLAPESEVVAGHV